MPRPNARTKPEVFHRQKDVVYRKFTVPLTGPDALLVKAAASAGQKSEQLVLQELIAPGLARLRQQAN